MYLRHIKKPIPLKFWNCLVMSVSAVQRLREGRDPPCCQWTSPTAWTQIARGDRRVLKVRGSAWKRSRGAGKGDCPLSACCKSTVL